MKKTITKILIFCFAGLLVFLTFNRHSKSGYFNYQSEIWADKAGYYVYLPAALKFNFEANKFPKSIDEKTGLGFKLDSTNNKVNTKYTYGVALLEFPFYLIADNLATSLNFEPNGFSPIYHWSINVAAVFYLILGLFFLKKFLQFKFNNKTIYLVLLSILLGTNLYYYAIDETGMSHVYSFFLFSLFLFLLQKTKFLKSTSPFQLLFIGITSGLIILIRPINILFLTCYLFLEIENLSHIKIRVKRLLKLNTTIPLLIGSLLIIIPQFIYWHYLTGSTFFYSYENKGFNWTNPKVLEVWFSPNNGLFIYTPFFVLLLLSMIYSIIKRKRNGWYLIFLFLSLSYVISSWWAWNFGCSYGSRNYVEYLSIFCISLAYFYEKLISIKWYKSLGFTIVILAIAIFNLKMIYCYDECFFGTHDWDWSFYLNLVKSMAK